MKKENESAISSQKVVANRIQVDTTKINLALDFEKEAPFY